MSNSANNVVAFPGIRRRVPAQNMEEVYESVQDARLEQIENIVDQSIDYLMYRIVDEGYDISDPKCMKDQGLLEAAMRSLMAKAVGLYDPLQDMAEELFNFDDLEEGEE